MVAITKLVIAWLDGLLNWHDIFMNLLWVIAVPHLRLYLIDNDLWLWVDLVLVIAFPNLDTVRLLPLDDLLGPCVIGIVHVKVINLPLEVVSNLLLFTRTRLQINLLTRLVGLLM